MRKSSMRLDPGLAEISSAVIRLLAQVTVALIGRHYQSHHAGRDGKRCWRHRRQYYEDPRVLTWLDFQIGAGIVKFLVRCGWAHDRHFALRHRQELARSIGREADTRSCKAGQRAIHRCCEGGTTSTFKAGEPFPPLTAGAWPHSSRRNRRGAFLGRSLKHRQSPPRLRHTTRAASPPS